MLNTSQKVAFATLLLIAGCSKNDAPVSTNVGTSVLLKAIPESGASAKNLDDELTRKLPGLWRLHTDGVDMYCELLPGHQLTITFKKGNTDVVQRGTWEVKDGAYIENIASSSDGDKSTLGVSKTQIKSVTDREWQISDDGKAFVLSRASAIDLASNSQGNSSSASEQQSTGKPEPAADAPLKPFLTRSYYVATTQVEHFNFTVTKRSKVDLIIDIDNTVPVDVIVFPFNVSEDKYANLLMNMGMEEGQKMIATLFGNDARLTPPDKHALTEADLFALPLSKKGAYGHYESDWQVLAPGTYTVFVDNEGSFTPTRGDAPIRVTMYGVPAE
jgi:hypothetical protein